MFSQTFFCVPIWSLLNRVVYNGLYYFCKPLFRVEDYKLERITSNIISSYHGLRCVKYVLQEYYERDILFTYFPNMNYNHILHFSISYFIYDILNDIRIKNLTFTFLLHHSISIISGLYLYSVGLSQLYLVGLFVELSNLNLNIKDILDILEMKNIDSYLINGLLFSVTFFVSRIVYAPIALRSAYILTNEVNHNYQWLYNVKLINYNIPLLLIISFISLNIYWFHKIVKIIIHKYDKKRYTI